MRNFTHQINIPKLAFAIIICQTAGIIGAIFTAPAIPTWYAGLVKPAFNPPNWIFGPVWVFLYALMGIALYLVLIDPAKNKQRALWAFGIQLALNSAWSIIFFGLKNILYAWIELAILLLAVSITMVQFWKINKKAALLLFPYLAWGIFAFFLNYSIWDLNYSIWELNS